jgi:hypothetical protein
VVVVVVEDGNLKAETKPAKFAGDECLACRCCQEF